MSRRLPLSSKRRVQMEAYRRRAVAWKRSHPWCLICQLRGLKKIRRTRDVHHTRGRSGSLLNDERFWIPACGQCHDWVHHNMNEARAIGALCPMGKWNTHVPPHTIVPYPPYQPHPPIKP